MTTPIEWFFAALYWLAESESMPAQADPEYQRMCVVKCGMCLAEAIGLEHRYDLHDQLLRASVFSQLISHA